MKIVRCCFIAVFYFFSTVCSATGFYANTILPKGGAVTSENGKYKLIMQFDGNLVLYRNDGYVRWATYKYGDRAVMQPDGNFVQYSITNVPLFATFTFGNTDAFLNVQDDGNLVVYSSPSRPPIRPLWFIGVDDAVGDPSKPGDVVGRDLAYPVVGVFGHLGIYDGERIVEVIKGSNSTNNVIGFSNIGVFKALTPYWGVVRPGITNYNISWCFELYCTNFDTAPAGQTITVSSRVAIMRKALYLQQIGATYTLGDTYVPVRQPTVFEPPTKGIYRCDTFVIDVLSILSKENRQGTASDAQLWKNRISALNAFPVLPRTVFDRLKTFR
jgi:hypothetical protein